MEIKTRASIAAVGIGAGLVGMSAIASWTAGEFGHHAVLGGIDFLGLKVYAPHAPFTWFPHFHGAIWTWPEPFFRGLFMSGSTALVSGLFAARALAKGFSFGRKDAPAFGAKHWGTMKRAIKAGLVMGKGGTPAESDTIMFAGKLDGELLTVTDGRHISAFGPSGAGKTRSVMTPSLLAWTSSALVYAAGKGDVIEQTSGFRATFSDVRILDLGDLKKSRFNPLAEIRCDGINEVDDAQVIASQFVEKDAGDGAYWNTQATRLLGVVILHVLAVTAKEERNLGTVRDYLQLDSKTLTDELLSSPVREAREVASSILAKEERARDSIIATAAAFMKPWDSPKVRKVTSESDFRVSDLVAGNRPFTLYLRVPSDMREVWRPVLKVIVGQITRAMMHDEHVMADGRRKRHKLGLFLDEFHSFFIPGFGNDLAEMRSYGMTCLLCSQSPKSLRDLYGQHETITENCRVKIFMASGDPETARMISEKIGTATEVRTSQSRTRSLGQLLGGTAGQNEAEQTRLVMSAGDVRAFDNGKMLLEITGEPVFQVEKLNDFDKHPVFKPRLLPPVRGVVERKDADKGQMFSADELAEALE